MRKLVGNTLEQKTNEKPDISGRDASIRYCIGMASEFVVKVDRKVSDKCYRDADNTSCVQVGESTKKSHWAARIK